jgi:cobalt-zinc-cadmium efflux system outer membrane protein
VGPPTLDVPADLPGADAPPLRMPKPDPAGKQPDSKALLEAYPPLPPVADGVAPAMPATGQPLTLADLKALAVQNSPVLRRAAAEVEAARGAAVQAGLYPNPVVGFQGDQIQFNVERDRNPAQHGAYVSQLLKVPGKLQLAQAAAAIDAANAEVALRRAHYDLAARVRAGYFEVLVAQEALRVARAVAALADEVYRGQVAHVRAGQAAAYEPLQLYVQSVQARNAAIRARNRYVGAWKRLSATLGLPETAPTLLEGRPDAAVPLFHYDRSLDRVLAGHTELVAAQNAVLAAQYRLRLAEITPVPDVETSSYLQKDNASSNHQIGIQVGVALPLFDRNQGAIQQARAQLAEANENVAVVRNDLVRRVAEAFERYENARQLVANTRDRILPNQVRVYRGVFQRYQQEPDKVNYNDLAVAQQGVGNAMSDFLAALAEQWAAVVELANLLQLEDLYAHGREALPGDAAAPIDDSWPPAQTPR